MLGFPPYIYIYIYVISLSLSIYLSLSRIEAIGFPTVGLPLYMGSSLH